MSRLSMNGTIVTVVEHPNTWYYTKSSKQNIKNLAAKVLAMASEEDEIIDDGTLKELNKAVRVNNKIIVNEANIAEVTNTIINEAETGDFFTIESLLSILYAQLPCKNGITYCAVLESFKRLIAEGKLVKRKETIRKDDRYGTTIEKTIYIVK